MTPSTPLCIQGSPISSGSPVELLHAILLPWPRPAFRIKTRCGSFGINKVIWDIWDESRGSRNRGTANIIDYHDKLKWLRKCCRWREGHVQSQQPVPFLARSRSWSRQDPGTYCTRSSARDGWCWSWERRIANKSHTADRWIRPYRLSRRWTASMAGGVRSFLLSVLQLWMDQLWVLDGMKWNAVLNQDLSLRHRSFPGLLPNPPVVRVFFKRGVMDTVFRSLYDVCRSAFHTHPWSS